MATKINLKDLVTLFVRTAEKYEKEPLGMFAAKMAVLTANIFQLTKHVVELDQVVTTLVKQQQAAAVPAAAPAPSATAPKAVESATVPAAGEEEEQDEAFNDIERETAAELAAVMPLRKPADEATNAKEAS